jgi:hypothetical protein
VSLALLAPSNDRAPRTVEETGLPFLFLAELLSKVLAQRGQLRLAELAGHTKLNVSVIDPLIAFLRTEKLCEVARIGNSGTDADLCYILTEGGRARAHAALGRNAYAGPAPVTLAAYVAQVKAHSVANMQVTRGAMAATFDGVVVNPVVLDQIGAGMNSGRALFLHGAAGSGKTYLAERLRDLLVGTIDVPHALMVDGEVIPFFDNVQHCVTEQTAWTAAARPTCAGSAACAVLPRWPGANSRWTCSICVSIRTPACIRRRRTSNRTTAFSSSMIWGASAARRKR